jgi:2-C-methyl-D-erythritol 4-phosphate cytidylyltransferase
MTPAARRWAIVPAAGRGERFGDEAPKQYAPLLGRPVLSWAVGALLAEPSIDGVVVVLAAGDGRWRGIPEALDARVSTCAGGERREHSVLNAIDALAARARETDWVLVHDAARPCLRREDLRALLEALGDEPVGGLLALPVSDTLKRQGEDGRSHGTVAREGLWRALTPQMFRYGLLSRALTAALAAQVEVTDEAAAVERLGIKPVLIPGRSDNLKITHAPDLALAEAILAERKQSVTMVS